MFSTGVHERLTTAALGGEEAVLVVVVDELSGDRGYY